MLGSVVYSKNIVLWPYQENSNEVFSDAGGILVVGQSVFPSKKLKTNSRMPLNGCKLGNTVQ